MSAEVSEAIAAMIAERQEARELDFAQRQESRAAFTAAVKTRRRHGLIARHRAKLARAKQQERLA